jgi:hypothetical protein
MKKYKLIYKENDKEVTVIADDPDALMIVLGQKVAFGAGKYRSGPKFELIFYGAV